MSHFNSLFALNTFIPGYSKLNKDINGQINAYQTINSDTTLKKYIL